MGSISRYIVRSTLGAFLLVLVSLTSVIWVTHILRDIDLVTTQGQTAVVFVGITLLLVPALVLVIAPLAFMLAAAHSLNKLNADSEIIVMNASGMSPWRIFLPFLSVALIVSVMVAFISAYLAPKCLRELRTLLTKVRADLIANIIQPGRFTPLEGGRLIFHIRERRPNGELLGLFIDDRREANERATFLAERGQLIANEAGTYLVLEQGSVQRLEAKSRDPTIVQFERYAFDLTQFTGTNVTPMFNATERYIWDLVNPNPEDDYVKANGARIRTELHDRLVAPFYPLAFAVLTFAVLGAPRTTRENRGLSLLLAIVLVIALRMSGFAGIVFGTRVPSAIALVYFGLAAAFGFGLWVISRGTIVEPPEWAVRSLHALQTRFARAAPQT